MNAPDEFVIVIEGLAVETGVSTGISPTAQSQLGQL
jgi:hypothetical protein